MLKLKAGAALTSAVMAIALSCGIWTEAQAQTSGRSSGSSAAPTGSRGAAATRSNGGAGPTTGAGSNLDSTGAGGGGLGGPPIVRFNQVPSIGNAEPSSPINRPSGVGVPTTSAPVGGDGAPISTPGVSDGGAGNVGTGSGSSSIGTGQEGGSTATTTTGASRQPLGTTSPAGTTTGVSNGTYRGTSPMP